MRVNINNSLSPAQKQRPNFNKCRLDAYYKHIIAQDYLLKQNIKNIHEIPKISKIDLHFSSKAVVKDKNYLINALVALQLLSGQKAVALSARKSVAAFKLRKNQKIGCKVTLRGNSLYYFLDCLLNIVVPRLEPAEISKVFSLDKPITGGENNFNNKPPTKNSNLNFGLTNLLLFPQLENQFQFFDCLNGINVTITTNVRKQKKQISSQPIKGEQSLLPIKNSILYSGFQIPQ